MEVNLSAELTSKLSRIAAEKGQSAEALVEEAVSRFVDYDKWFITEVENGLAAADRREFVEHAAVRELIDRRYPG